MVSEKNKEILDLKERILISNAEHRLIITNERDKLENDLKSKDNIIKEKNKTIAELQQYKAVIIENLLDFIWFLIHI